MTVIDCVKSPPEDAMRAAGVVGVVRYLSLPQANTAWKRVTQAEYDRLRAAGFDIVLNWEYAANDWLGGAPAGKAHAAEAVKQARALGYPAGCAIPGSADLNMTLTQWNAAGKAYAQTYSAIVRDGGYVAGVYGPWDVLTWCQQLGGFGMFWQSMSTSWSGGRNAQLWPGAHLRQRRSGFVGGFDVDFNDIIQANYGQCVAPIGLVKDESIEVPTMFLSSDANGGIYLCDGMKSRHIASPDDLADVVGKYETGALVLQTGDGGPTPQWWTAYGAHPHLILTGWTEAACGALPTETPVQLTDDDRAVIIAGVSVQLGAKLDEVLAAVKAQGTREASAAQAEADALKG